jgi:ABC-type multidrug transport system fused ATPase/permease subunit
MENESYTLEKVQEQVEKVWKRARSNAFAHRAAAESYLAKANNLFTKTVVAGLASIIFVILVYIVSSTSIIPPKVSVIFSIVFTLASVLTSVMSLFWGISQSYYGFERLHQQHDHNQHSYLLIAQRAREVAFPEINLARAVAVLEDLERDFQILKVRGREPEAEHWRTGNAILYSIKDKPEGELQSFTLDGAKLPISEK